MRSERIYMGSERTYEDLRGLGIALGMVVTLALGAYLGTDTFIDGVAERSGIPYESVYDRWSDSSLLDRLR